LIKSLIDKLLGKARATGTAAKSKNKFGKRMDVSAAEHKINLELVDERAVEVVQTLKSSGFEAYIVGGAVRDLLLGLRPKDFDVATNATPEEVKRLFRRAFIIGRRFRIVHVVFGRGREHEVIEVSTFRAHLDSSQAEQISGNEKTSKAELAGVAHAVDESGRVLRDNVWGPQDHDAARRDFTINAMYYDPTTQLLVDYHGGMKDAAKRVINMIGDPAARYREDPVRLIRAVRFAAKLAPLGFAIGKPTAAPLKDTLTLLADVPQSRLFDEMLKLLQTGHGAASIEQLKKLGLAQGIYPLLDVIVARSEDAFLKRAIEDTDRRVGEGKPVAPSFLLACALWSDVRDGWEKNLKRQNAHPIPALQDAIDAVFARRIGDVSGAGRLAADMREIWLMQPRFEKRLGSSPFGLVGQARFRASFDFLRLRADAGDAEEELATWWEDFSMESDTGRDGMVADFRDRMRQTQAKSPPKPKKAPVRTGPRTVQIQNGDDLGGALSPLPPIQTARQTPADDADLPDEESTDDSITDPDAPKRRRRRRRKPRTGDDGSSAPGGSNPE
jgi:poly(A) polymerase